MTLDTPAAVQDRLAEIENDLAVLQNNLEDAGLTWFRAKRQRERDWARAFVAAEGTVADRKAAADLAVNTDEDAWELEGRWEALRAKARVLEGRAQIGMSLLKSQSRIGAA